MINLKIKGLPDSIEYKGDSFQIKTDYRAWLDFPQKMNDINSGNFDGYISLFADDVAPLCDDTLKQLLDFYSPERIVPKDTGEDDGPELMDYTIDGDYIYAGFMQAYGIDLIDADMHWHKFLALLAGLPEDTVMSQIIKYRAYDGNSKDVGYKEYKKLQQVWELPVKYTEEEQRQIDEFESLFGG
jgi:hypothetical protein